VIVFRAAIAALRHNRTGRRLEAADPSELAQKTPKIDPNADAEAIFWDIHVEDKLRGGQDLSLELTHYIRIKFLPRAARKSLPRLKSHASETRGERPRQRNRTGKRIILQPAFFQRNVPPRFTENSRNWDIYFHYGWTEDDTVTIELPENWEVDQPVAPHGSTFSPVAPIPLL
jgi:hypothetical protein